MEKDERVVELKESINNVTTSNYKERLKNEYWQTKTRYNKLHKMLIKLEAGTLDFEPVSPKALLEEQARYMGNYLKCLEIRAEIENINLDEQQYEVRWE